MADINISALNSVVLAALNEKLVLGATIKSNIDSTRGGKLGQSIDVYVDPLANVEAKTYSAADKSSQADYDFDALDMTTVPVTLRSELYAAVEVDSWDNLVIDANNVGDFVEWIDALSRKLTTQVETSVAAVLNAVTDDAVTVPAGLTVAEKGEFIVDQLVADSLTLDSAGVSAEGRFVAVGANVARWLLANKDILNAEKSGSTEALRSATIGEIAGFVVVKSPRIAADSYVAYNSDAFVLASRAPGKNVTAAYSELATDAQTAVELRFNILGLGRRNATGLIASTFYEVADIDSEHRAIRHTFAEDTTEA